MQLTFPVVTQRPFKDPAQYENIILRASQDGSAIVRLKDVARVEVGRLRYVMDSRLSGLPATFVAVYQQPGANALQVSEADHLLLTGGEPLDRLSYHRERLCRRRPEFGLFGPLERECGPVSRVPTVRALEPQVPV